MSYFFIILNNILLDILQSVFEIYLAAKEIKMRVFLLGLFSNKATTILKRIKKAMRWRDIFLMIY